jgi:hypothetical protein
LNSDAFYLQGQYQRILTFSGKYHSSYLGTVDLPIKIPLI